MKKKMISTVLAVIMAASLAACTGKAPAVTDDQGNTGASQSVTADGSGYADDTDPGEKDPVEDTVEIDGSGENTNNTDDSNNTEEPPAEPEKTLADAKPGEIVSGIVKVAKRTQKSIPDNDAMAFVRDMEIGWNLGNTFDASDCNWVSDELEYESAWCGTKTTKELISEIRNAGFKTIRIPVSWHNHIDADYNISEAWMSRVEEVVGWAYDEGMYIIINVHHDNSDKYEYPSYDKMDQSKKYLTKIWTQIADRFADYDEHIIFETMNEPRQVGKDHEWWIDDVESDVAKECFDCINKLNQTVVDTIRANGKGYNSSRYIMVPGYCASPNFEIIDAFVLPDDSGASAENRIIVSAHAYTPYNFALNQDKSQGATDDFDIFEGNGTGDVDWFMGELYSKFVSKGTPVVIGEFGALDKGNLESRMQWTAYYIATAKLYGMTAVFWDNNAYKTDGENFRLIDRASLSWTFPELVDQMMYYCRSEE